MEHQSGGCLCGDIRYLVTGGPVFTVVCHCKFCQKILGSAFNSELLFEDAQFEITSGKPRTYLHISEGSGKPVTVHFCGKCGSNLYVKGEAFPETGVFKGTLDHPDAFQQNADNSIHIFADEALNGTVIPAGVEVYTQHTKMSDGTAAKPVKLDSPKTIKLDRNDGCKKTGVKN